MARVLAQNAKTYSLHKTLKTIFAMQNGEPGGSPFLLFSLCRPRSPRITARVSRERRAPHARCDQLVFRSKPGGVIPPLSVASELTLWIYPRATRNAREIATQKIGR